MGLHRQSAAFGTEASSQAGRAAELAEARAGKAPVGEAPRPAFITVKPPANDILRFDRATQGIMKMQSEPKGYVDDPGKSAADNRAAMQAQLRNLQGMLKHKETALHVQAELQKLIKGLEGRLDPVHDKAWSPATSVDLEAVFKEAEAAVSDMQARLGKAPDADSDTEAEFFDALSEFALDSDVDTNADTDAAQVQSEPPEATVSPRAGETSMPTPPADRDASVDATVISTDHVAGSAATESPSALSESAANAARDGMARDLLRLNTMYMGYHVSGVLDLVGNVRAMDRRIAKLEELLAQKEEMLQDHADLKEQLADPNLPARLEWSQFKLWRAAAEMRPEEKFDKLAASISNIRASMNRGVEALIWDKGYKMSEIFKKD
ncbi:hypothetical protein M5C99_07480 [Acidovorax sp. NCPPB 2350]|nr:hypothetical protein M5C99_07480 [Acidovorax sp. NCPPB 2350]